MTIHEHTNYGLLIASFLKKFNLTSCFYLNWFLGSKVKLSEPDTITDIATGVLNAIHTKQ